MFKNLFTTPARVITAFAPIVALLAAIAYFSFAVGIVPGDAADCVMQAVGYASPQDLSHPIYTFVTRFVCLGRSVETASSALTVLSCIAGVLAVVAFYLTLAYGVSLISIRSEIVMRGIESEDGETPEDGLGAVFVNVVSMENHHTRFSVKASVVAAFAGALAFMFAPPVWMAAGRPCATLFDLALFFGLAALLLDNYSRFNSIVLYVSAVAVGLLCIESPLFFLLLPLPPLTILHNWNAGDEVATPQILLVSLLELSGISAAWLFVMYYAQFLDVQAAVGTSLFAQLFSALFGGARKYLDVFGVYRLCVYLVLPVLLAIVAMLRLYARRTYLSVLIYLAFAGVLMPTVFNLDNHSLWAGLGVVTRETVMAFGLFGICVAACVAALFHMLDSADSTQGDEDEHYETDDQPGAGKFGFVCSWLVLLVLFVMPYRSFVDVRLDAPLGLKKIMHELAEGSKAEMFVNLSSLG